MELARGTVGDRAWGCTLAGFARNGLTGELAVGAGDKQMRIVLNAGAIAAASSPLALDAAARIGMTLNIVTSTQVAELARRVAAAPNRDEVEVIAETLRLAPELALRLRRRVIALRAARTFALEGQSFAFDDRISLPVINGAAVDVRSIIYLGARTHMTTDQLERDLRGLGSTVAFTPELVADLSQFGFGDADAVVGDLHANRPLAALVAGRTEGERRMIEAVVYALVTWTRHDAPPIRDHRELTDTLSVSFNRSRPSSLPPERPPSTPPPVTNAAVARQPSSPNVSRTPTPSPTPMPRAPTVPPMPRAPTPMPRAPTVPPDSARPPTNPPATTSPTSPTLPPATRPTPNPMPAQARATQPPINATAAAGSSSPSLSRTTTPLPNRSSATTASQLVARASQRFAAVSASGSFPKIDDASEPSPSPEQVRADAEDARRRGEMALRRDQFDAAMEEFRTATKLQPKNGAYSALLAWTQFCAAGDKHAIANEVRKTLAAAMQATEEPIARLYLGKVERMLGREKEALRHFRDVLDSHPRNTEAQSEARVLEGRLANKSSGGFGKPKR